MGLQIALQNISIDQDPLFLVFLNLRKADDTVDQEHILIPLEEYVAGPLWRGLLETFWDRQKVVPRKNGFH